MNKEQLIKFEEDIASCFNQKMIKAPIHLYNGNEEEMIDIFKRIKSEDWVFCTWRSHYQCLLKGVPEQEVKDAILKGKSISLCFPQYKVFSSAIVTGVLPIAVGTALSIKLNKSSEHVYCFVGDMTSETGAMWEAFKYSYNHKLPITFIVEDNGKSVCSDTRVVWNQEVLTFEEIELPNVIYYQYNTKWPHAGSGERIQF